MIGVVGSDEPAADLAAAAEGAGLPEVVAGEAEAVLAEGPEVVVALGEQAAAALFRTGVDVPVLPVGAGLESVPLDRVPAVLRDGLDDRFHTRERPVLTAAIGGEDCGRGLFDAMLVTSEPARISEFAVETANWTERYRADGVVVSTPAGSEGYARAVGGPVLDPESAALSVVPVAAFSLRSTVRVAAADATIAISVEREEGDVSLLLDGRERRRVPPHRAVTIRVGGSFETVVDPAA